MFQTNKILRLFTGIILILLIIFLGYKVNFVFIPFISLINNIIVPLMLAGFFYYLLRPLVQFMHQKWGNRTLAIVLIYVVFLVVFSGLIIGVWPSLREQLHELIRNLPNLITELSQQLEELEKSGTLSGILPEGTDLLSRVADLIKQGINLLGQYLSGLVTFLSNFFIVLFITPVFLFFMLKEGGKFGDAIIRFMPKRFREEGRELIQEIDESLGGFIVGRVISNLALGVLMYIGFLIIDLPYALLLTVISVILNFVPFIGAIVSAIPIVIIGFIQSPSTAVWALVIILCAQQIQDNILAPYIFKRSISIHPITSIVVVLVGQDIGGLIGVLIAIPLYTTTKIVLMKLYHIFIKDKWEKA
ncbi:AI-2E family transporter [Neobacillus mesonae]|nr:AI-2E family transporter [Neobacillus mesonae]